MGIKQQKSGKFRNQKTYNHQNYPKIVISSSEEEQANKNEVESA